MADVFVSYSRQDSPFVTRLAAAIESNGKKVWIDTSGIEDTEVFPLAIRSAIESSDAFLFVISPASVASPFCEQEVDYALSLNKRLVPVLLTRVPDDGIPDPIRERNWIPFEQDTEFEGSLSRVMSALDTDLGYRRSHTRWLTKAIEWDNEKRDRSLLLRGSELRTAETWLAGTTERSDPAPTTLQRDYLLASRQAAGRRSKMLVSASLGVTLLAVGLLVFALISRSQAVHSQAKAQRAATVSLANSVGAEAVDQPNLVVALLLAREAVNIDQSEETKSDLLWTLMRSPQLTGEFSFKDPGVRPNFVQLSPDGTTIAVQWSNGQTAFYDTRTLREIASPEAFSGVGAYSYNSPLLLGGTRDGTGDILLVNSRTYRPVRKIDFPAKYQNDLANYGGSAFGFANRILLAFDVQLKSGQWQSFLYEYDTVTGKLLRQVLVARGDQQWAMVATPDGRRVVVEDATATFVYNGRTLDLLRKIKIPGGNSFAMSPDGQWAAYCSQNGNLTLVNLVTGKVQPAGGIGAPVGDFTGSLGAMAFTPDDANLVIGTSDGQIIIWDRKSESVLARLEANAGPITAVTLSDSGSTLFASSLSGSVLRWNLPGDEGFGRQFQASKGGDMINIWLSQTAAPLSVDVDPYHFGLTQPYFGLSPDGHLLAAPTGDGHLIIWDISKQPYHELANLPLFGNGDAVTGVSFSPNGRFILVSGDNGQVWMITPSGRTLRRFVGLSGLVWSPLFSPNGRYVVADDWQCIPAGCLQSSTPGTEGRLAMWDASNGRLVHPPLVIPDSANQLSFSPNGSLIAVPSGSGVSTSGYTYVVSVPRWRIIRKLDSDPATTATESAVFSPRGHLLATVGEGGLVRIWDTRTWQETGQPVQVSSGTANSLSFDPTGQLLATGASDGTVRILNVSNPAAVSQFGPPSLPATTSVATNYAPGNSSQFSADGSELVVVDSTGVARVYPMRWQQWAADACAIAGGNLTESEWEVFVGASRPYAKVCPGLPLPG